MNAWTFSFSARSALPFLLFAIAGASTLGCGNGTSSAVAPPPGGDDSGATADSGSPHMDGGMDGSTPADSSTGSDGMGGPDAMTPDASSFDAGPVEVVIAAAPGDDWHANDNAALDAFGQMYSTYSGQWSTGPRWSFANGVEATEASFARSGGQDYLDMIVATYDLNSSGQFLDDLGYDDEAWWAHAWVRAYDLTGDMRYLAAARTVFADMTSAWETATCGGGIWWNRNRNYKNAVTNELFLLLAGSLHNRTTGDQGPGSYLDWALKEWAWFKASGMINSSNTINDGLNAGADGGPCTNNGQTTWTYNQGVVLGGLVELYEATGDASYLTQAEAIADGAIAALSDANGVMHEPCGSGGCDEDQVSFKGIFVRNLARLHDRDRQARYFNFMVTNARSLWAKDRDPNNYIGSDWAGPFDVLDAPRQQSGMFALSSLADPISPASPFLRPTGGPTFNHAFGALEGVLGWACDAASCPAAGQMQSGPFVSYLPLGDHTLHARVAVDATSSRTDVLATLQVFDQTTNAEVAAKPIAWSDLAEANVSQDIAVPYTLTTAEDALEYRVNWNAVSGAPHFVVTDIAVDGEQSFTGANLDHECGRLDGNWHWSADPLADKQPCLMTLGPGARLDEGDYTAHFELRVDEQGLDDAMLATLTVFDRDANAPAASMDVHRGQFATTRFQLFTLPFHAPAGHHWELRTQWLAAPTAPRLHVRGLYLRHAVADTSATLPFNLRGMGTMPGDGSIDNVGSALDLGVVGTQFAPGYHTFAFGQTGNNVLQGGAPAVTVSPAAYASIELLGFAVNGNQADQAFTIAYADGTSQTVTRSVSDWTSSATQAYEDIAFCMPYRWSKTAKEYGNFHVFHYSLPTDPTRNVQSFQLPANANVIVLAATLVGR